MSTNGTDSGHQPGIDAVRQLEVSKVPLEPGIWVVEASAGTGKTTAIARLCVRALALGYCTIDQVALVTFTNKAVAELRSRVHAEATGTLAALRGDNPEHSPHQAAAGLGLTDLEGQTPGPVTRRTSAAVPAPSTGPEPAGGLGTTDSLGIAAAIDRLEQALANFDQATIATHHSFAQQMLDGLGILADHDASEQTAPNLNPMITQLAADQFVANGQRGADKDWKLFLEQVRTSIQHPEVPLVSSSGRNEALVQVLQRSRAELATRLRRQGLFGYEDLITRLRRAVDVEQSASAQLAIERIGRRYRLVMVDEFQDTDRNQWQVLRALFGVRTMLVLIGDPKQSIYNFRGADVGAYLDASAEAGQADQRLTLTQNYRSGQRVVDGVKAIIGTAELGPGVTNPTIAAADPTLRLEQGGPDWDQGVQVRVWPGPQGNRPSRYEPRGLVDDVVAQVGELVHRPVQVVGGFGERPLRHRDIAILCRSNFQTQKIRRALSAAGIAAAVVGDDQLFASPAARNWAGLLGALVQVNTESIRRAALNPLIGWSVPALVQATERELEQLSTQVHHLARVWRTQGFGALREALEAEFAPTSRLLAQADGEDLLCDLTMVADALTDLEHDQHLGPQRLLDWLVRGPWPEMSRHRGSGSDAVQVMTVHKAKGLGFDVVLAPYAWWIPSGGSLVTQEPDQRPFIDVDRRSGGTNVEADDEELRLLYVTLTRARAAVKLWWCPTEVTGAGPLDRLLQYDGQSRPPRRVINRTSGPNLVERLSNDPRFATVGVASVDPEALERSQAHAPGAAPMPIGAPRQFTRSIDRDWRRTSYSGLTAHLHTATQAILTGASGNAQDVDMAPDVAGGQDEPDLDASPITTSGALLRSTDSLVATSGPEQHSDGGVPLGTVRDGIVASGTRAPMADIPGGTRFGTLVHQILEHLDPAAPDLRKRVMAAAEPYLAGFTEVDPEVLVDALVGVLHTPLTPLADATLATIGLRRRLAELDFELQVEAPDGVMNRLAELFCALPAQDRFHQYGPVLAGVPDAERALTGYLNGSIDAVLKVPNPAIPGRDHYLVVDYKTNTMPRPPGQPLLLEHYHPEAMAQMMMQAHYPLQAVLYSVALHRYLSWRVPDYDPGRDLGPIGYLFVRGMAGPDTPIIDQMTTGVFCWDPGSEFILAADAVIGGNHGPR